MTGPSSMRLDKWLWAARFFKTRVLATDAISGGKVHVDGGRTKPSREVRPGTVIRIHKGQVEWTVVVVGLNMQRRPANEAAKLYEETPESLEKRHAAAELRRLQADTDQRRTRRPDKRGRRLIHRFRNTNQNDG